MMILINHECYPVMFESLSIKMRFCVFVERWDQCVCAVSSVCCASVAFYILLYPLPVLLLCSSSSFP